jgi:hypothetical protein
VTVVFAVALLTVGASISTGHAMKAGHDPRDPFRKLRLGWDEIVNRPEVLRGTEVMGVERGVWVDVLARDAEMERLREAGVSYDVLVEDLEAEVASRRMAPGFGIYHTFSEAVQVIDDLHSDYPSITTDKISLGSTWEGNPIWAMKISDNPDLEEPDEPEVLFDGGHHAREVMGPEILLDYMTWLCGEYGTDPEATDLVNSRQIWFVPIVNVDGYLYNEQTNPNGGGMWRKNRRDDLGGCIGVDLNRNYPYQWGLDSGSSGDPCATTYRGPSAASELETQVLISFIEDHEFVTHNSYHSVVGAILFPWAYTNMELTPDDATFRAIGDEMARDSGYEVGTVYEVIFYLASGGMFDWTYGEQTTKPKIFSFSTEVGGSGNWPAESEVPGLLAENHWSNVFLTRAAGVYLGLEGYAVAGGDGNGRLDPGETADLVVTVRNFGVLADAAGVTVTLASDDSYLALSDAFATIGAVAASSSADNATEPFSLTALAGTPVGHSADLTVEIADASGFRVVETLSLVIGQAPVLYANDFEADAGGWGPDPSHTASTGAFVRIDPNPTAYQPGDDTTPDPGIYAWVTGQNSSEGNADVDNGVSATRSPTLDLATAGSARLTLQWFHGQRDPGDDSGDFFRIDLSNDDGATYPVNLVSVGDVSHAATWRSLAVDLESELPLTTTMRIRVQAADGSSTGDIVEGGIDDIYVLDVGSGNAAPGAPTLVSPADGSTGQPTTPTLVVANAVDPEGDPLTYTFRVYGDSLLTQEVASTTGVAEGTGTTAWTVSPPLAAGTYWWRSHAADPELQGPYMGRASFAVQAGTDVPSPVALVGAPTLAPPRPNPSARGADIAFSLPARSRVRIDLFDLGGRHVLRLFEGVAEAGPNLRHWDGRDTAGRRVSAGVYFVQMQVGGVRQTQKMVRLR